ncbi:MAG: hypothetical protein WBI47_04730 [Atribacterales bacterium]
MMKIIPLRNFRKSILISKFNGKTLVFTIPKLKLRYQRAQTYQVCVFVPQYTDLGAFQLINEWLDRETFVKLYRESALVRCNLWVFGGLLWCGKPVESFLTVKMVIGTLISSTPQLRKFLNSEES